jgi:hypothetical protein
MPKTSKKKRSRQSISLLAVRARARSIIATRAVALAPGSTVPGEIHDLISTVADHCSHTLRPLTDALLKRVESVPVANLAFDVDEHFGALMAVYGDAGYFVGLSVGLEVAALGCGVTIDRDALRAGKGGAR